MAPIPRAPAPWSTANPLSPAELFADLRRHRGTPGDLLLVQDLDGVCMELVRDPLERRLEPGYVLNARRLDGRFNVLTNGEHAGYRGVNRLVEQALAAHPHSASDPASDGLYLPGLAAGGVQWQNRFGSVSTPGVHEAELAFLAALPARMAEGLRGWLPRLLPELDGPALERQIRLAVLDNPLSPTVNLNSLFRWIAARDADRHLAVALQEGLLELMGSLLAEAEQGGLTDSFFLHIAPNLLDAAGEEQPVWASHVGLGTTDVQFMLRGAIKEAGLLVLINGHIAHHHGVHPLGAAFHVRNAPRQLDALLELATARIPAALMPRLVGVADTITSRPGPEPGSWQRGGSDRGFLTLLQQLGQAFDRPNRVVLVDSSGGEVCRPSFADGSLAGLTDPQDPLQLDALFRGGPPQYRAFFGELAAELGADQP